MERIKKTLRLAAAGLICGAANGLFGSGGGIVAVPALEREGTEPKKAHATSIAVILPITLASAAVYSGAGLNVSEAVKYIPGGLIGAYLGSVILKRISAQTLKRLFSAVMIYFGIRMMMR